MITATEEAEAFRRLPKLPIVSAVLVLEIKDPFSLGPYTCRKEYNVDAPLLYHCRF